MGGCLLRSIKITQGGLDWGLGEGEAPQTRHDVAHGSGADLVGQRAPIQEGRLVAQVTLADELDALI